ncbi:F-box protein [Quillaja saponaria]|uniref:F-box protein n=1 Tax=Quillaja saponaria TaxID=32244 RepID=A0AAD7M159_QUISA|nr:F-box protein [Quillaja saponaria]
MKSSRIPFHAKEKEHSVQNQTRTEGEQTQRSKEAEGVGIGKQKMVEDRLSNLPDGILQHILSLLVTKIAVQTSVLGKRWRYLWTSLSTLHFSIGESFSRKFEVFQKFVNHVLSHRDASTKVSKFRIECCLFDMDKVDSSFHLLMERVVECVRSLEVEYPWIDAVFPTELVPHLFNCQSLKTLEFIMTTTGPLKHFHFIVLTSLDLIMCTLTCNEHTFDPFRGCLNLKSLLLDGCSIYEDVKHFQIYAPQLTDLSISDIHFDNDDRDCKIVSSSPKLKSFAFIQSNRFNFSIECLSVIENVYVSVHPVRLWRGIQPSVCI